MHVEIWERELKPTDIDLRVYKALIEITRELGDSTKEIIKKEKKKSV